LKDEIEKTLTFKNKKNKIKKERKKAMLGKPRGAKLIFKACNPWNIRHKLNKGHIQTN